ncbi:MAG: ABC transporter permease [Actinomycetota bacterium]|nr:ABC transporter permease [Actinomycetota bacterium]
MARYVIRRVLWVMLVILLITFFTYLIFFKLAPDPVAQFAGKQPTPKLKAEIREQLGLDKPMLQSYGLFVKRIFLGDEYGWPGLGFSYDTRTAIKPEMAERAWVTLQLALGAAVVWLLMGIPIGIISALKRRTLVDRAAMGFALFGVSAPVFFLGLLALWVFWKNLGLLPGTGYIPFSENPGEWLGHFIMPWFVLALLYAAFYARMVRGNLIETMGEDYIRTARAKGLTERRVVAKHGLRASLTPIVTMFGMDLGLLLGGALITERVFNLPGLGDWVVQSVTNNDFPVVVAVTLVAALTVTLMNLVVDIVYAYLDPRVRYS